MVETTNVFVSGARCVALLASLALLTGGCGDGAGAGTRAAAVADTVAGVERFHYPQGPAGALDWRADTVAVLGDAFAEEAYQFDQVTPNGLAAGPDGQLLVLDRQGKRLLRYSTTGQHLGTLGREGAGPGELSQPSGLALGPGDTVWVSDFSNSRLTGFPLAGGDPRVLPLPDNSGVPSPDMAVTDDGITLQFRPLFNFRSSGGGMRMSRGDGSEEEERPLLPLARYDAADLSPLDTLWTVREAPADIVQLEVGDAVMITIMSREFHPAFRWGRFSEGGLVVSDTAAYLLRLLDADGTVRRIIERDPPPRTTTEPDRVAARERVREEASRGGGVRFGGGGPNEEMQRRLLEQRLEKMTFAELIPRVVALRVDPLDRIWVGVAEDDAGELARIDVYDRDGRLLGELRGFPMPDVFLGRDHIGVLRRDELDVQQVVVMEVRGDEASAVAGID